MKSRPIQLLAIVSLFCASSAAAQPSFTESIYVVAADPEAADSSAHELCFDEFRGTLLESGSFVARNESEVEETVSGCTEDLSSPNYVQECMLNVATSQVDWIFMINVEDFGGGDFLLNGRGFQSATNAEVWSERRIVSYQDIRRAALDGCAQLGDDFLASRGLVEDEPSATPTEVAPQPTEEVADEPTEEVAVEPSEEPETTTSSSATYPECPWDPEQPVEVSSDMTTVTIQGTTYDVVGRMARQDFRGMLVRCGELEAEHQFERWRKMRRNVNTWAATLIYSPFASIPALRSNAYRENMNEALADPEL